MSTRFGSVLFPKMRLALASMSGHLMRRGDVEVAVVAAIAAHMSFAGDADARAVRQAGLDVNRQPLAAHLDLVTRARRTRRLSLPTRPAAMRARL